MRRLEKPNWQRKKESKNKLVFYGIAGLFLLVLVGIGSAFVWKNVGTFASLKIEGKTIFVKRGASFQDALDRAKAGDTILLEAGAEFVGSFKLPKKAGDEFITIRTSAKDAQLPPENVRLDPKKYAAVLPKLTSPTSEPVVRASDGAHHYRFVGVEFGETKEGVSNIILLGSGGEKRIEDLPHHIEFDRVYVHGSQKFGQRRGIAANGRYLKIANSYFSDFKREGEESQAIAIWATDGHIEIVNNYLEAAAEPILIGGADSALGLVPSDILIKDNWMTKPFEWRNSKWVVKNLFEIKTGKRIKITNNMMTNNWAHAQEGMAVIIKTGGDSGESTIVEDIEFSNNIVKSSASGLNIFGGEGNGAKNLIVRNNIFYDIDGEKYEGGRGAFIKIADWDGVIIENNTAIHTGEIAVVWGGVKNFVFRNNIVFQNEYGFKGDGTGGGKPTLVKYFPNYALSNNIIVGGSAADYGRDNFYPTSIKQIGFENPEADNFVLQSNSPYKNRGFQGKQVGANLDPQTVGGTRF